MIKTDKNLSSTYKETYLKKTSKPVKYSLYKKVNLMFYDLLLQKVFEGEEVILPCSMGTIKIVGTKREKFFDEKGRSLLPPDWVKTKKLWEKNKEAKEKRILLRHTNEDTGGVSYRISWRKYNVPLVNKTFISFRLTRKHKRVLSSLIKEGKEYIIVKHIK